MTPSIRTGSAVSPLTDRRSQASAVAAAVALHAVLVFHLLRDPPAARPPMPPKPILVSLVEPPRPKPPEPVIQPPKPRPVVKPAVRPSQPQPPVPVPAPLAAPQPGLPETPVLASAAPTTPAPREAPVVSPAPAPVVVAPPAPPPVVPLAEPRFDAAYLNNPAPAYPSVSRRLGEQGKVLLRVHVDEQGVPLSVVVRTSSGHERLDNVALETVRRWKFVPARRGSEAVSAWVLVPIVFNLRS